MELNQEKQNAINKLLLSFPIFNGEELEIALKNYFAEGESSDDYYNYLKEYCGLLFSSEIKKDNYDRLCRYIEDLSDLNSFKDLKKLLNCC